MLPLMDPAAASTDPKMLAKPGRISTATDCPMAIGDALALTWRQMANASMRSFKRRKPAYTVPMTEATPGLSKTRTHA